MRSRYNTARRILIFWTLFLGIGAVGKLKGADYILVYHQSSAYENAADEMDSLLGIKRSGLRSVRCRMGTYNA